MSLASTSIIGTLIPQNKDPETYFQAFGDFMYRFLNTLDIFDMYHSWWFQLLLVLLCINIIICSIDRLSATWNIIFTKKPVISISRFKRSADQQEFTSNYAPKHVVETAMPFVTKGFTYNRTEAIENGFCIFAEKYRWTRLGVYVVHFSILLLLIGALIGSIYGFDGYVNIAEGETTDHIQLTHTNLARNLGFKVRCDDFNVSFYENTGTPSEFMSRITVLEDETPVLQKDIVMNDPLRYKGINFFQSSYGKLEPLTMTLDFTFKDSGMRLKKQINPRESVALPDNLGTFSIQGYREAFAFRGQNLGETFFGIFSPKNGSPEEIILPARFHTFDRMRNGAFSVSIADADYRYYTGLHVAKDPGVWVVYTGFIVLILGCYITFFKTHQQIFLEVTQQDNKSRILISGISNKNHFDINRKVNKIYNKLKILENKI